MGYFGTNTAALSVGGQPGPGGQAIVEEWDGSSWTEIADLNTARRALAGSGTVTAGLACGGWTSPSEEVAITEEWNGSSWSEVADISTGVAFLAAGTSSPSSSSINFGGITPSIQAITNEWTKAVAATTMTSS